MQKKHRCVIVILSLLAMYPTVVRTVGAGPPRTGPESEKLFLDYNLADIKRNEDIWRQHGGEIVTLPEADAKKYVDLVTPVTAQLLSGNPKVKDDYEALLAAAKKYRK